MLWFWKLLGWSYYGFGKNHLWLKGCLIEELPKTTLKLLYDQSGSVPLHLVARIRKSPYWK